MKKISFKKGLLIYAGVLVLVIIGLLLGLRGILVKYEKAQAYNLVGDFAKKLENGLVFNEIGEEASQYIDYSRFSRFEDKDTVTKNYINAFAGKKLEYTISSKSFDANNPVYIIHCGDQIAGELSLKLVSEEIKLDMLSIPTWAIDKFTPELSAIGKTYAVTAPDSYVITVNGRELTKDDIPANTKQQDNINLYMIKGLLNEPAISVKNAEGEDVAFTFEQNDKDERLVTVKTDYTIMNFTIPAMFKVESKIATSVSKQGSLAVYTAVFSKKPDADKMNETFTITDLAGSVLKFTDKDGVPVPNYYEYTILCPDTLTVRIGEEIIDRSESERIEITAKQYSDVSCLLKSKFYSVYPVVTDAEKYNLNIRDKEGKEIDFKLDSGVVSVEAADITITVPDNFGLKINGADPDVAAVVSDFEEYEDIKAYVAVPHAKTYVLKEQYAPVNVTIVDNRGDSSEKKVADSLVIKDQAGSENMPASFAGQIDPVEYGKQYSRFMSDAIGGADHGYGTIRKYIMNGSYLDTSAYAWATGIDITFLGRLTYDNPPFSKESASNFVTLSDTLFYCDVYFIKSFTVNSTGLHRDDVFSKRMFFYYTDDDNDGVKSWVIVHMTDIVAN